MHATGNITKVLGFSSFLVWMFGCSDGGPGAAGEEMGNGMSGRSESPPAAIAMAGAGLGGEPVAEREVRMVTPAGGEGGADGSAGTDASAAGGPGGMTPTEGGGVAPAQPLEAGVTGPIDAGETYADASPVPPPDGGTADASLPEPADAATPDVATTGPGQILVERIIDVADMPASENGVYTDSGRFFVIGGEFLYEVVRDADGFEAIELLRDPDCLINALVDRGALLYAACTPIEGTTAELLRVDPTGAELDVRRTTFPPIATPMLLNGMEFGPDGALYISNSFSSWTGEPSVVRVEILSEDPLQIAVSAVIDQVDDLMPNGMRFDGDDLFFATGTMVTRRPLARAGAPGEPELVYSTDQGVVDDFDLAYGRLFLARTDSLDTISWLLGGPAVGSPFGSALVVTDLAGNVEHEVDLDFIPSSTAARRNTLFGQAAVVVTSVFTGGLYRVQGVY